MKKKFKAGIGVLFYVKDINRSEKFYREVLGIQLDRQKSEEGPDWLLATLGKGIELMFFEGEEQIGRSPIVVFELEEGYIETVVENLSAQGVEIIAPVSEAPGGWSTEFLDPDGFLLSFYQSGNLPLR